MAARDTRLRELQQDDSDGLYELRFGGKERVWGIRRDDRFCILWWDPEHMVCPSTLKNT